MLRTRELDGEAILEMSHCAALHLAEGYESADRRTLIGGDAGARLRHVDDAAGEVDAPFGMSRRPTGLRGTILR